MAAAVAMPGALAGGAGRSTGFWGVGAGAAGFWADGGGAAFSGGAAPEEAGSGWVFFGVAAEGAGTSAMGRMVKGFAHFGHFACLPALASLVLNITLQ